MQFSNSDHPLPAGARFQPFKAQYEHVLLKQSPDGHAIQEKVTGAIYRDSWGRERVEKHSSASSESMLSGVEIYDPVSLTNYSLHVQAKAALKYSIPEAYDSNRFIVWQVTDQSLNLIALNDLLAGNFIGQVLIEGHSCMGYSLDLPEGGGIHCWYSEQLRKPILLQSKVGSEESMLRLFNILCVEPDPQLFEVPADYQILSFPS